MNKTKKQLKKEEELIKLLMLITGIPIYLMTQSFELTFLCVGIFLFIYLLIALVKKSRQEKRLSESNIKDIDSMNGVQFEYYLSSLFNKIGYKSRVTKSTGDYGADLVIYKGNEKIVVQAKRYSKKVGIRAVQEISASKAHYKATKAWVVTNSYFTKSAIDLARSNDVRLFDREDLIDLIIEAKS